MRRHPRPFHDRHMHLEAHKRSSVDYFTLRRRDFTIGPLSQTTTIVILVCAGVVVIAILAFLIHFCRPSTRSHPAPLPPCQELAHRREHQLSQLAVDKYIHQHEGSQRGLWLQDSSTASLVYTPSLTTHETLNSTVSTRDSSPVYATLSPASSSHWRSVTDMPCSSGTFSPEHSPPSSSAIPSADSSSESPTHSRRASRVSAIGMSSRTSHRAPTLHSSRSRISGAPHGPHNNVQIVLPAPLAPQVYQHMVGAEDSWGRRVSQAEPGRQSIAMSDAWVGVTAGISTPAARQSVQQRPRQGNRQRNTSTDARAPARSSSANRSSSVPPRSGLARTSMPPVPVLAPAPSRASAYYGIAM